MSATSPESRVYVVARPDDEQGASPRRIARSSPISTLIPVDGLVGGLCPLCVRDDGLRHGGGRVRAPARHGCPTSGSGRSRQDLHAMLHEPANRWRSSERVAPVLAPTSPVTSSKYPSLINGKSLRVRSEFALHPLMVGVDGPRLVPDDEVRQVGEHPDTGNLHPDLAHWSRRGRRDVRDPADEPLVAADLVGRLSSPDVVPDVVPDRGLRLGPPSTR